MNISIPLYILSVILFDAQTGDIVQVYESSKPITYAQCESALRPDARGVVMTKDGIAEMTVCRKMNPSTRYE